jgi:hypothetical protein
VDIVFHRSVRRLKITAAFVKRTLILIPLTMEALGFPETWVRPRATRRDFSEDGILHGHCRVNLKSYVVNFLLNFTHTLSFEVGKNTSYRRNAIIYYQGDESVLDCCRYQYAIT